MKQENCCLWEILFSMDQTAWGPTFLSAEVRELAFRSARLIDYENRNEYRCFADGSGLLVLPEKLLIAP